MKNPAFILIALAVVVLGAAGIWFLASATGSFTVEDARTPALVSGIVCLSLATGLLLLAAIVGRTHHTPRD